MLSKQQRVDLFKTLFCSRKDVFARRWQKYNGSVSGYAPVYKNWRKKDEYEPLTKRHIESHLLGRTTLGVYPLLEDNTSHFIVVDFDGEGWQKDIQLLLKICEKNNVSVYVERSRSGNGGHIWCFFENAYPAHKSRAIFLYLLRQARQIDDFDKDDSFDRLFPSQDYLSGKGLGNLIALPLQGESRKQDNAVFVDLGFEVHEDQWELLNGVTKMSVTELDSVYIHVSGKMEKTQVVRKKKSGGVRMAVSNNIEIPKTDLVPALTNYLRDELNFLNADYIVKQRMGFSPHNIEKYFKTIQTYGSIIHVPIGFLSKLQLFCKEQGTELYVEDKRSCGSAVAFKPSFSLLGFQKKAVQEIVVTKGGVLIAPPGSGKTIMGIAAIAKLKHTTLILTHRRQIHNQWLESIESFLNIPKKDIGQFASAKKEIGKHITVAMVQTISRMSGEDIKKLTNAFGVVIVDECHHMPAHMFRDVVSKFNSKYLYGLTATPKRKNNDEKLIYAYIGEIAHEILREEIGENIANKNSLEKPVTLDVIVKDTKLSLPFEPRIIEFNTVARIISHDSNRNEQISEDVLQEVKNGRMCLVLTERKEHANMLYYYLKRDVETILFTGDLTPKKREIAEKQIKNGEFQVLIATGHIFGEGADVPSLDCLFLAFPFSFEGKLIQYIGRIQRGESRMHKVYDYRDGKIELLDRIFKKRQRYYNKLKKSKSYETLR
jgi:superfamily II DNA or RNA helicase